MIISKSKYMKGLQCHKLLWTICNAADSVPEADAATQALFNDGEEVGELAQSLFPKGLLVDREGGCGEMIKKTQSLLAERKPIFEASFSFGGVYAQADILNPVEDGKWDIIEVKMTTGVKPQHIQDVALQRHCYEGAGLPIRNCHLMHINNQYVRRGGLDATALLAIEDVTGKVITEAVGIPDRIAEMHRVTELKECPEVEMGSQCSYPYPCLLLPQCSEAAGKENFVAPPAGEMEYDAEGIRKFLANLVYPLYLLDFETFMRAIPQFDGSWPYMQTPFQFSLQVVECLNSKPVSHSWLWDGVGDPRSFMLSRLRELIADSGSVMTYNKCFEEGRLNQSAAAFPEHKVFVQGLMPRMVDLIVPFRSKIIRHPAQNGSNSLKAVLPALTGAGYEDLEIQDGNTASAEFLRSNSGDLPADERSDIRIRLEKYCDRDTMGMLHILQRLASLAG